MTQHPDDKVERVAAALRAVKASDLPDGEDPYKHLARAAIEALSPAPAAEELRGWRPIESAPKDGTRVLLWMEPTPDPRFIQSDGPMAVCASYVVWSAAMKREGMKDGWSWYGPVRCHPTYWQPLPEPPSDVMQMLERKP